MNFKGDPNFSCGGRPSLHKFIWSVFCWNKASKCTQDALNLGPLSPQHGTQEGWPTAPKRNRRILRWNWTEGREAKRDRTEMLEFRGCAIVHELSIQYYWLVGQFTIFTLGTLCPYYCWWLSWWLLLVTSVGMLYLPVLMVIFPLFLLVISLFIVYHCISSQMVCYIITNPYIILYSYHYSYCWLGSLDSVPLNCC